MWVHVCLVSAGMAAPRLHLLWPRPPTLAAPAAPPSIAPRLNAALPARRHALQGNAIPLAIFLLGQLQRQPEDAALAAAAPALCATLQRLGARDAGARCCQATV